MATNWAKKERRARYRPQRMEERRILDASARSLPIEGGLENLLIGAGEEPRQGVDHALGAAHVDHRR